MTVKGDTNMHVTILLYVLNLLIIAVGFFVTRSINQVDDKLTKIESKMEQSDLKYYDLKEKVAVMEAEWKKMAEEYEKKRNTRGGGGNTSSVNKPEFILPKETTIIAVDY